MRKLKKVVLGVTVVGSLLLASGCEKENEKSFVNENQITTYTNVAKELTSSIHSSKDYKVLKPIFDKEKRYMSSAVYNKNFNLSKLEAQNLFDFPYDVLKYKQEEVFVEKDEKQETVNVVVVGSIQIQDGKEDESAMDVEPFWVTVTDVYRFVNGKIYEYVPHW